MGRADIDGKRYSLAIGAKGGVAMRRNSSVLIWAVAIPIAVGRLSAQEASPMTGKERRGRGQIMRVTPNIVPWRKHDYTFGFWPNGFRKEKGDQSPNIFCVETGRYVFAMDLADFRNVRLGRIEGPGYLAAAKTGAKVLARLPPAQFRIELEHGGKVYRAISCLAGRTRDLRDTILLRQERERMAGRQLRAATPSGDRNGDYQHRRRP